jgi:hypothetical protein
VQPHTWFSMQHGCGPAAPQLTLQSSSPLHAFGVLPPVPLVRPPVPVLPPAPPPPAPPVLFAAQAPESSTKPVSHVNEHFPPEQLGVEFAGTGSEQGLSHPVSPQPTPGDGT